MGAAHPLRWTGRDQTWNDKRAECHSTELDKHYDLSNDSYATTWAEIDVTCEACHGPGADHSAQAKAAAGGDLVCAQCHWVQRYAAETHHHHQPGSEGASCIGCHMPPRLYMVNDAHSYAQALRLRYPDYPEIAALSHTLLQ
jgi:hypothetical protein